MKSWLTLGLGLLILVVPTVVLFQAATYLFVIPLLLGLLLLVLGRSMRCAPADSRRARYGLPLALAMAVVGFIGPWALLAYLGRSGDPVRVVLPPGFTGEVRIVLDREGGEEVPMEGNCYVYRVPASGVLRARSIEPFYIWHEEYVVYEDGRPAKVASGGSGFEEVFFVVEP